MQYVQGKDYLTGNLNPLTPKRPLNTVEISHIFMNMETILIGSMLSVSFAQMAQTKEVTDYMIRGQQISQRHIQVFAERLIISNIQSPMSWDTTVENSTTPAFSEKLMMFVMTLMSDAGMANYGLAASVSLRADLSATYMKLPMGILRFVKSGADLMIKHGWFEEPPQAPNRKALSNKNANG